MSVLTRMGDVAGRHAELACRLGETLVPPGHVKETKHLERRSAYRLIHISDPGSRSDSSSLPTCVAQPAAPIIARAVESGASRTAAMSMIGMLFKLPHESTVGARIP